MRLRFPIRLFQVWANFFYGGATLKICVLQLVYFQTLRKACSQLYVEPNSDKSLAAKVFKCENGASGKDQ